jgi:hypothetical protein
LFLAFVLKEAFPVPCGSVASKKGLNHATQDWVTLWPWISLAERESGWDFIAA